MSYDEYGGGNPYYDGDNSLGGGGFLPNSQGFEGSPGGRAKRDEDTLRPVTIKQILTATLPHPDFPYQIEGHEITQVSIVALVRSAIKQATSAVYSLEDGTGILDVRHWLETPESDSDSKTDVDQNTYVRVIGNLKPWQNKLQVTAHVVKPITDFHEIFYHKAEALAITLALRKPNSSSIDGNKPLFGASQNNSNEPNFMKPYASFPILHKQIMRSIHEELDSSPQGVHVSRVCRGQHAGEDLMEAIEYLISEGHLYTGEDDEHVLPVTVDF